MIGEIVSNNVVDSPLSVVAVQNALNQSHSHSNHVILDGVTASPENVFQQASNVSDSNMVMVGGSQPGTWGESISVVNKIEEGNDGLITSGGVAEALSNIFRTSEPVPQGNPLPIADGGTGAITAAEARASLGAASFASVNGINLHGGTDFNNLTTPGVYCVFSTTDAATMFNLPLPQAGSLEVIPWAAGASAVPVQRYTTWPNGTTFTRTQLGGGSSSNLWSNWNELHDSINHPVEHGTWNPVLTGSATTGELLIPLAGRNRFYRSGNMVLLTLFLHHPSFNPNGYSGNLSITGLPFQPIGEATFHGMGYGGAQSLFNNTEPIIAGLAQLAGGAWLNELISGVPITASHLRSGVVNFTFTITYGCA